MSRPPDASSSGASSPRGAGRTSCSTSPSSGWQHTQATTGASATEPLARARSSASHLQAVHDEAVARAVTGEPSDWRVSCTTASAMLSASWGSNLARLPPSTPQIRTAQPRRRTSRWPGEAADGQEAASVARVLPGSFSRPCRRTSSSLPSGRLTPATCSSRPPSLDVSSRPMSVVRRRQRASLTCSRYSRSASWTSFDPWLRAFERGDRRGAVPRRGDRQDPCDADPRQAGTA